MRISQTRDDRLKVEARMVNATISLTRQQMAEWFQPSRPNVVGHIQHRYKEGDLKAAATCLDFHQVRTKEKKRS